MQNPSRKHQVISGWAITSLALCIVWNIACKKRWCCWGSWPQRCFHALEASGPLPLISAEIRSSPQRPGCNPKWARGVASPARSMGSAAPWAASGRGAGFWWGWSYWGCGAEVLCPMRQPETGNRASLHVALCENTPRQLGVGGLLSAVLKGSLWPNSPSSLLSLAPSPIPSLRCSPVAILSCCHAFGWPGGWIEFSFPSVCTYLLDPTAWFPGGRTLISVSEDAKCYQSGLFLCCSCIKYSSSRMGLPDVYLCLQVVSPSQWKCVLLIKTGEGS